MSNTPKYANGREVALGDPVVGRDSGGNLQTGRLMQTRLDGQIRLMGAALLAKSTDCLHAEDAFLLALSHGDVSKAAEQAKADAIEQEKADAEVRKSVAKVEAEVQARAKKLKLPTE